jgi:hypothetical protein
MKGIAMTVKDIIESANDSTLGFITSVQGRIVDVNKGIVSAVSRRVPEAPSWLPTPKNPDAKAIIEDSFGFQARLLEANRAFTVALVDAWAPATPTPATAKRAASAKK